MSTEIKLISEENYKEEMDTIVTPYLEGILKDDYFTSFDGKKIHYRSFVTENAKASVVISHGFTEFGKKFDEMVYYYSKEGYNVFVIDHRGHGYSFRYVENTSITHINSFDEYVTDFHHFISKIVLPESKDIPLYLYAHSMGGAVGTIYLMRHPEVFDKAVLTAPMIFPQTAGVPVFATKLMTGTFKLIGKGNEKVFVHTEFDPDYPYETSNATSPARYEYYMDTCRSDKHYQNNAATYNWVSESLRITKIMLNPKNCAKIKAKVFLLQAENDKSVVCPKQNEFITMVRGGKLKQIKGSKHEIFLSNNTALENYLDEIFNFYNN